MAADADFNPDRLVEEGLQLYGRGELDAALVKWKAVLEREPDNRRAREYLKYVEDNRAALEESFSRARHQTAVGLSKGLGLPGEPVKMPSGAAAQPPADAKKPAEAVTADGLTSRSKRQAAEQPARLHDTPVRKNKPERPIEPEPSRQVLDLPLPHTSTHPTAEKLTGKGRLDLEPVGYPHATSETTSEAESSIQKLADEIAKAAERISTDVAKPAAPAPSRSAFNPDDDNTPRLDLVELKAKVAETKARLSQQPQPAAEPPSAPPAVKPFERPTAPLFSKGTGTLPGVPAIEESSISSRPTPSRGSTTVPAPPSLGRRPRMTPLTLVGGSGSKPAQDFEPLEVTPVAQKIPRPARLVPAPEPRDPGAQELIEQLEGSAEEALEELTHDPVTPAKLSKTPKPVSLEELAAKAQRPSKTPLFDDKPEHKRATFIGIGPEQVPSPTDTLPLGTPEPATSSKRRPATPIRDGAEKLESLLESARQLHEQGTFEGSLWLCERVLTLDSECSEAQSLLDRNQQALIRQYRQQLGDAEAVPVVQIPQHEIMWHKLDHRAGFLLSRIDGQLSFEDLLDVSGMSEFEACRILSQLMSQGVIGPRR